MSDEQSKDLAKNDTLSDYIIMHTIGKGTFSKVKLGIHKKTKKKVAIKILEKAKIVEKDDFERIVREMSMVTEFDHINVIKVYEMYETDLNYLIVMEYCEKGELFNYIVEKRRLSEEETAYFFYQLINGIEYIHSMGVAHRDLKPENLLLDKDHILKIIDFGLSNYFNGDLLVTPCGSPCYASPEMVCGNRYNGFYIDVWSTGIILFAMLCGFLPFEDPDNEVLFQKISDCNLHYPSHLSKLSKSIMKKIIVPDPQKRITIEEIKEHEFYLLGKRIFEEKFHKSTNDSFDNIDFYKPPSTSNGNVKFIEYFGGGKKNNKISLVPKIQIRDAPNKENNSISHNIVNTMGNSSNNANKVNNTMGNKPIIEITNIKKEILQSEQPVASATIRRRIKNVSGLELDQQEINSFEKSITKPAITLPTTQVNTQRQRTIQLKINRNKNNATKSTSKSKPINSILNTVMNNKHQKATIFSTYEKQKRNFNVYSKVPNTLRINPAKAHFNQFTFSSRQNKLNNGILMSSMNESSRNQNKSRSKGKHSFDFFGKNIQTNRISLKPQMVNENVLPTIKGKRNQKFVNYNFYPEFNLNINKPIRLKTEENLNFDILQGQNKKKLKTYKLNKLLLDKNSSKTHNFNGINLMTYGNSKSGQIDY